MLNSVHSLLCEDVDGLLSQALLVGNFESAVDICIGADRMVSRSETMLPLPLDTIRQMP